MADNEHKSDVDISCTLSDQPTHLLFSYPIIYKALDESINTNFRLNHHQYVSHTIMSFLSSKNIHLIPSRNVNVDTEWLDEPNASVVTLLAVSVHDNQPLFRISSTLKDLPKSWTDPRERDSSGCCSASYALHVTGNHLWIEYEEGDECFSDEEAWNNEDPSVYYEMRTHHLFHSTISPAHNAPTRLTRVSHRRKMECPLKINKWDIFSGKRELVKWDDGPSDGYSLIKNTDLSTISKDKCDEKEQHTAAYVNMHQHQHQDIRPMALGAVLPDIMQWFEDTQSQDAHKRP